MRAIELTGKKFNRLTVLKRVENSKHGKSMWLCKCDCGNETIAVGTMIRDGLTKSCGCLLVESTIKRSTKHGMCGTKLYNSRMSMYSRCYNKNNGDYKHYGGRGIKICDEWLDKNTGIQSFIDWSMKNGYKEGLTIDRIDVNGDYEPSNCRWVDRMAQAQPLHRRKRNDNTSNFTGVEYRKDTRKWMARITINKKHHYLGEFKNLDDAITARRNAEIEYSNQGLI